MDGWLDGCSFSASDVSVCLDATVDVSVKKKAF